MTVNTRPTRDQVILRMATEEGIIDQGLIAKRLTELGYEKIGAERVGQILRASSGRDKVIHFLEEHPDDTYSSTEISNLLKLDINKVNYVIDALAKRGVVTFKVGQASNNHRTLVDVSLTKRARSQIEARVKAAVETAPEVDHAKLTAIPAVELQHDHRKDKETIREVEAIEEVKGTDRVKLTVVPTEAPQSTPEEPMPAPEPEPKPEVPDSSAMNITDYLKYPLIGKLMDRERDLNEAAKLLDRHGFEDLELAVLAKADEYTPLEREIVKFIQAHRSSCQR